MKIVVLDGYTANPGDLSWAELEAMGELTVYDRTPEAQVVERVGDAEIALVNKTPMTRAILQACPGLKYIGVMATGYDVVDVPAAADNGVLVTNVPTYGTTSVAQMAIALLLEVCHHVSAHSEAVHNGDWTRCPDFCFWNYPLIELAGKKLGVVGFGRIGQNTAKIAEALGMQILAYDQYPNKSLESDTCRYVTLEELYAQADVITLHCPLLPGTKGMINRESIARMKDGVILLNTSRGPLVAEQDVTDALNSGKLYYAGLDVVNEEPMSPDNPLLKAKNCFLTPHIAGAPREARARRIAITSNNLRQYLAGTPVNVVTK